VTDVIISAKLGRSSIASIAYSGSARSGAGVLNLSSALAGCPTEGKAREAEIARITRARAKSFRRK